MDLKLNKESIFLSEVVFDNLVEQGVEFDYILPDYYPDIFKILKCQLTPKIISYSVSGDKLSIETAVNIKILYLTENNKCIKCIDHRASYSKTVELSHDCKKPVVFIMPKIDYCNCRAVTSRRLDVRAAVSLKIKVSCTKSTEVISTANGCGVQSKLSNVTYGGMKLNTNKQYMVREEIDIGQTKEPISSILHYDAVTNVNDYKVIANKVIIKGEAQIKMLYTTKENDDNENTEVIEASVPLSQIVDLDGVSDEYTCFVNLSVMYCDLMVKQNSSGENKIIGCDLTIEANVVAHKESNIQILSDAFSTDFNSDFKMTSIKAEKMPQIINQSLMEKTTIENKDGELDTVSDAWCTVSNIICRAKTDRELSVSGQLNSNVLARLSDGTPIFLEKQDIFESVVDVDGLSADSIIDPIVNVVSTSYSMAGENAIDLRIQLSFKGCLYLSQKVNAISNIAVDEENPKPKDTNYALKLYYSDSNESIWDIAKKYNTSPDAIIAENDLENTVTTKGGMLLIPII